MRRIAIIAAMLTVLGTASQPAEAGDRGIGFRHFSAHAGAKFDRPHDGRKFHHRGIFGKHRQFSRHGGAKFDRPHRGLEFHRRGIFGKHRHPEPRHFRHFDHGGLVLRFDDRGFAFQFGRVPQFKPHRFKDRHGHSRRFSGFDRPGGFKSGDHGFAFRGRNGDFLHFRSFGHDLPRSMKDRGRRGRDVASEEAILKRLEELGFRHVPRLLRERSSSPFRRKWVDLR